MSEFTTHLLNFDPCVWAQLILHQLQGAAVAPAHTGGAWRYAAEIAFKRDAGLRLDEIRFFRAGCPAEPAHIILVSVNLNEQLRGAGSIDKWAGDHRIIAVAVPHDPDSGSPGIGCVWYMIQ